MTAGALTFLAPLGAIVALALALPLAALALSERRVEAVRRRLGLRRPHGARAWLAVGALAAVPVLLALAATQPTLRSHRGSPVRTDAEAFFVFDTSRSMLASARAGAPTRLQRAKAVAIRMRAAIPEIPSGVATLTDRVLPDLFPTQDAATFDSVVRDAVGIERPPPEETDVTATAFDSLGDLATQGFFTPDAKERLVVLLTDGESRPFSNPGRTLHRRGVTLLAVRFWGADERVFRPNGRAEAAYRPNPSSGAILAELASAAGGHVVQEDAHAASDALRADVGSGPTEVQGTQPRLRPLAPYVAAVALVPLLLLLRRRNFA